MDRHDEQQFETWRVISERTIHDSPWMKLTIADVALPDGSRLEHRIVRYPGPTAGVLIHDTSANSVLLLWRHRFITDQWGWEVPAGLADAGESPSDAAVRETAEETGYKPREVREVVAVNTSSGLMDERYYGYYANDWEQVGESDVPEASAIKWVPAHELPELITNGGIQHAHSLMTVLMSIQRGYVSTH